MIRIFSALTICCTFVTAALALDAPPARCLAGPVFAPVSTPPDRCGTLDVGSSVTIECEPYWDVIRDTRCQNAIDVRDGTFSYAFACTIPHQRRIILADTEGLIFRPLDRAEVFRYEVANLNCGRWDIRP